MTDISNNIAFDAVTQSNLDAWLNGAYDDKTKVEIRSVLAKHPQEIVDAFYKKLSFGTGGMRGIMGVGSNRMNYYTVRAATQGLANYLKSQNSGNAEQSVVIGYDSRNNSRTFAEECSKVLAGNGIKVYLFKALRPTPLVSFGVRFKKASAGIMITASHNPPEYNGYKVYWSDGGQVLPPHDIGIIAEVDKIDDPAAVKAIDSLDSPLIVMIQDDVDDAYLKAIATLPLYPEENRADGNSLKIVYTSLHGTGITLAPSALRMAGFTNLSFVDAQIVPDGAFPTATYPNPEEKAALKLGIEKLQATGSDLFLATDPDADRVGAVVMHEGHPYIFNGNQVACICLEHICRTLSNQEKLTEKDAFIKTIVTTELFRAIATHYNTNCIDVLPGFKYIAEQIRTWEQDPFGLHYIFGGEESYGYLFGTFSRDKDAIVSSVLIAEVALHAKLAGKTLVNNLQDIYETYGIYCEKQISVKFEETKEGQEAMKSAMELVRQDPFTEIEGYTVVALDDYLISERKDFHTGKTTPLTLPKSDALTYWLEDGSKLMIRPSGTEPKVKVYCGIIQQEYDQFDQGEEIAAQRATELLEAVSELLIAPKPDLP